MDTPGNESTLTSMSLGQQAFSILVYDVTDRSSFDKLEDFVENFNHNCKHENRLLYIVGNKIDSNQRQVTYDEGNSFAAMYSYKYFETSAKTGANVDEVFMKALQQICDNLKEKRYDPNIRLEKFGIRLNA